MEKKKRKLKDPGRTLFIIIGLIPLVFWTYYFVYNPLVTAVIRSFTNWSLASTRINFIGFANYTKMLTDRTFGIAFFNTIYSVILIVPATVIISLLIALMLNAVGDVAREIMTPIYFLPSITAVVVIASIWRWLYHPSYGIINYFLSFFGVKPVPFLQEPRLIIPSIAVMTIWGGIGYYAVILLAALKSIPPVYYEAATIDGAGPVRRTLSIRIPLIKPNILFVLIMTMIGTFQIFVPINVMTKGGPGNASQVLSLYIYLTGVNRLDMGYASAISMVLFIIIMIVTILQWIFVRSDWEY